jgi:alkylated DNA repair dioxygenase AlkB
MHSFREIINKDGRLVIAKGYYKMLTIKELSSQLELKKEYIKIFGKKTLVPRTVDYQGEIGYSYSGIYHPPKSYHPVVRSMINEISETVNHRFNSVLFNDYENGNNYMGYHKDNEPELDHSYIASVSLGATRKFNFKHEDGELLSIHLDHGDLLIMENFQEKWRHCLPKTKVVDSERLNLTFRKVLIEAPTIRSFKDQ